ncbi:hypothetical protein BDN70DRAFT_994615 [Pholiota conissans]|uniref:Uncharacterized protein n=1 Tax=Pholiota conissans TaxID=109636 RepID=A0A9P6CZ06_9AGAR|nr:hypothetical protein BDN70DRAFT_994615 [Pholiota conissans]
MAPKTSREILAAASASARPKKVQRKAPTNLSAQFQHSLSTFSATPAPGVSLERRDEYIASPGPTSEPNKNKIRFCRPITGDTFAANRAQSKENLDTQTSPLLYVCEDQIDNREEGSGPAVTESAKSIHEQQVAEILSLLRIARLSPFDLILEVLDKQQPQYSDYRTEFYKEDNQKLLAVLDKVASSSSGKEKISAWIKGSGFGLVSDTIEEDIGIVEGRL